MSENLKHCLKQLDIALKIRDTIRRNTILKFLLTQKPFHKALKEICQNLMKNNIPLNPVQKAKINRYSTIVTQLGNGIKVRRKRQEMIRQAGGFLPWLIPIIASLLLNIKNQQ